MREIDICNSVVLFSLFVPQLFTYIVFIEYELTL